jgi:hypothetical protein
MAYVGPTRSASFRTDVNNVLTRFGDHVPLEIRVAPSQAEAYGSAHANLEHQGQRYTWRPRWDDEIGQRYLRRLEEPTC